MSRPARRTPVDHTAVARRLRAHPGRWMPVGIYRSRATAESTSYAVRSGRAAYGPAGAYKARTVLVGDETRVEAKYVGPQDSNAIARRGRWVRSPMRDQERVLGQIARGEVRTDAAAVRAIAARHEEAYGAVWRQPSAPGPDMDAVWADAVASLTAERKDGRS